MATTNQKDILIPAGKKPAKNITVEGPYNSTLNLTNEQNKTVVDAFSREVNLFLHCHLRGYDRTGCGEEMYAEYFDKYGAPVNMLHSWMEGYRDVEKQLALHFDACANPKNELPLIAGYGGGAHLYQPIKKHDDEPWNMTGWVPLENKWCCEGNFFKNRHFLCLRGNEIQNDLWDYHPYVEDTSQSSTDSIYDQYVPLGPYIGGYWFKHDVRGRYLHIIALKSQGHNDDGNYDRYNFIVHPLAYRDNTAMLPDNSVDGMQWSITNVVNEGHFNSPGTWGEKCHGLEIFNDFTYYYSWQPIDGSNIFNGTKMNYDYEQTRTRYHFWFNTYPLEFGEFLLDSALTMGSYLHPVSANDAFYDRKIIPIDEMVNYSNLADTEGMERVLLSDPKGVLIKRLQTMSKQEGCSKMSGISRSALNTYCLTPESRSEMKNSIEFRADKPYAADSVFGYVAVLDYKEKLKEVMENNPPPNIVQRNDGCKSGLNLVEPKVIKKLQNGQFFGHTGVFDFLDYSVDYPVPFTIPLQQDKFTLCSEITDQSSCIFTFPKSKAKICPLRGVASKPLVWRYMIQKVVDKESDKRSVETTYGYFTTSTVKPTRLDLSNYGIGDVCWVRFTVFNTQNPQKRAWFPAVRGPAFAKSADKLIDIAGDLPLIRERIVTTTSSDDTDIFVVKEDKTFLPSIMSTTTLDLVFRKCEFDEQDDIYAYFFQSFPIKQPIDPNDQYVKNSKVSDTDPTKPFAPRIMESVHGYFQLCDEYPSRINLTRSWDETTVVDNQVSVYAIDSLTAQPKHINHLILDQLPTYCFSNTI